MSLLSQSADYTDRDFDSWRARLRTLVLSVWPDWTDDKVANFGNVLVELYAYVGDMLSFYQDAQAAESRLTTATQRKNLLAIAKMLNYTPSGAAAATGTVAFTLAAPVASGRTVTFNPPATPTPTNSTVVKTADSDEPVEFQLTAAVTITAGNSTANGTVENSEKQGPETFASTGLANQEHVLSKTPFLDDSATVTADDGAYTEVTDFLQSISSDRHFTVRVNENDKATFVFGNGVNGKIPVGNIVVNYKTGGGAAGNVPAAAIAKIEGSFVDSAGDPVTVTVTNAQASSGGADREGNDKLRENAPLSLRSLTRTVARDDFENHALKVTGVDRALMFTPNEDVSIVPNSGNLYVVPTGAGFPTTALKDSVLDKVTVEFPSVVTFTPNVVDPIYVDIGVTATLFLKPGHVAATVRANIIQALNDFFALRDANGKKNELIDFGWNLKKANGDPAGEIALSDVFNAVRDVTGVREIGDGINDFHLSAYRVIAATTHYTGGGTDAVLVQALAHTDVPVLNTDFPRLKTTVLGGSVVDVDLTIDGVNFPPA